MVDRVQVIKRESAALGGDAADEAPWDAPIEPQEDAIEVAGVFVQSPAARDEAVMLSRDAAGNMTFKDAVVPGIKTLAELLATGGNVVHVASFADQFEDGDDEISGSVSGLIPTPVKIAGFAVRDDSGDEDLMYGVKVSAITGDGFDYTIRMLDDESWEEPTPLNLTIDYVWAEV